MPEYQWAIDHRNDGYSVAECPYENEADARLSIEDCLTAGLDCRLLRRKVEIGPWEAVEAVSDAS